MKPAKVCMSGRSQAVRIPAEFRLTSSEVSIHRDPQSGDVILLEKPQSPTLTEVFAMLDAVGDKAFVKAVSWLSLEDWATDL